MPARTARDYAQCRSMGHEWKHRKPIGVDDPAPDGMSRPFGWRTGCIGKPSQCSECKMYRIKWITRSGEVMTRYTPPEGYSLHGEDRLSPRQWRVAYVASIFEEFTHHVEVA